MFGLERLQAIRELILEKKSIEVTYLSQSLNVSEVTIRRDLDKLEKEGLIVKTYGGAILVEESSSISNGDTGFGRDEDMDQESILSHDIIAKTASKLIEEGDTVFIGGSAIGIELSKNLKDLKNIIVVTNNIFISMYLFKETDHKVIMLGGLIDSETGNIAEYDQLEELLIEKAFITVDGVDQQVGYTVNEKGSVFLYKTLKKVARHIIVLADSQGYTKRGLVKLAPLDDIPIVVTEKHLPDDFKSYYYEHNIKVVSSMLG